MAQIKGGMEWIRKNYNVPAKRGMTVIQGDSWYRICSATETGHLVVEDGDGYRWRIHPTDGVYYDHNDKLVRHTA